MSDELASVLGHPLRARLLCEYDEPSSPSKVAQRLRQRVNLVSYHTNVLHQHGWITLVGTARRRGAVEHFYRSVRPAYIEDDDWERVSPQLRRAFVLGFLGITRDESKASAFDGGFDAATAHLSRTLLELDEQGVNELAATLREVISKVETISASCRERDAVDRERHEVVIEFFRVPRED